MEPMGRSIGRDPKFGAILGARALLHGHAGQHVHLRCWGGEAL